MLLSSVHDLYAQNSQNFGSVLEQNNLPQEQAGYAEAGNPYNVVPNHVVPNNASPSSVVPNNMGGLSPSRSQLSQPSSMAMGQGQVAMSGNQLVVYQTPTPESSGGGQQNSSLVSPLDQAVRELPAQSHSQGGLQDTAPEPLGESPLDQAIRELGNSSESPTATSSTSAPQPIVSLPLSSQGGGAQFKLIDISLDGLFGAGTSTASDSQLQQLEGGGHDPRKRGFTVRGVELSMQGAVDPYLDGEMHLVNYIDPIEGSTVTELEEAFFTTRSLPDGLQLKAGQYLTEFGRINPTHPHAWAWLDQPIIATRVFGPDGMRAPGARMSWLVPGDNFSQIYVGMQNANGEQMASFLANQEYFDERPVGGRPFVDREVHSIGDLTYSVRWETSWTRCNEQVTWLLGASGAFGPNCTGNTGNTQIYGVDLTRKWKPAQNERGWPFTIWTTEFIMRSYWADAYSSDSVTLPSEQLYDYGFYTQLLYGFKPKWAVGLRYEYVWGVGYSLNSDYQEVSNNEDPFRDNRHRFSPLLAWYLTEYSRFNFQYNFDYAEHLPSKTANTFWLGAEFMLGSHPAHKF